jgi:hypothetical protein
MKRMPEFMQRMDWPLLRAQKFWLLKQRSLVADGLLHLVDAIQDAAVDVYGLPEAEVFGRHYGKSKKGKR